MARGVNLNNRRRRGITPRKARRILGDGEVKGNPLTGPQRGFFGARTDAEPARRNPRQKRRKLRRTSRRT